MSCYKALIIWDKDKSDTNTQLIKNRLAKYLEFFQSHLMEL